MVALVEMARDYQEVPVANDTEEYRRAARGSRRPCPVESCGKIGTMTLGSKLVANDIGTYSLAGAQFKISGISRATITCDPELGGCGWTATGQFKGRYFVVDPSEQDCE